MEYNKQYLVSLNGRLVQMRLDPMVVYADIYPFKRDPLRQTFTMITKNNRRHHVEGKRIVDCVPFIFEAIRQLPSRKAESLAMEQAIYAQETRW
jgi:hypothetical protein